MKTRRQYILKGQARNKHGNLIDYRIGLVEKIGGMKVSSLDISRHAIYKYDREELELIIEGIKELRKNL
jgi:hypothetical protein